MLWLKIDGLGSDNTANKTCNYLTAATDFHALGIPIVADHIGGLPGLALLAFGAVGGLAHGITLRERFAASSWHKPRKSGGFLQPRRVYFPDLDLMMDSKEAERVLEKHPKAHRLFSCRDKNCCHRGVKDMFQDSARHFLIQRGKQLNSLNGIPEQLRPQQFLNKHLLPLTDRVLKAANYDWGDDKKMAKNLQEHRKRLDKTRILLGEYMAKSLTGSCSLHPVPRAIREANSR
jgi:hypothetical protein